MNKTKIEELLKKSIRTLNMISVPVGLVEEITQPILLARETIAEAIKELDKEEPEQTKKDEE